MMANQIDDKPLLPKEYVQLEYLESTGKQYIDLGYPFGYTNTVELDLYPELLNETRFIFGNVTDTKAAVTISMQNSNHAYNRFDGALNMVKIVKNERYIIRSGKDGLSNGDFFIPWESPTDFTTKGNVFLFAARNSMGTAQYFYLGKIYSCRIYENDVLIHNYIPALRSTDSKPGMYDLVTGQFFTNQGKGEFGYG